MTPEQIASVQTSFARVAPIAETAAELFYGRLFEIAPDVQPFFKGDMTEQGRKLMATLGTVVAGLDRLEEIVPVAGKLAVAHVKWGVKPEHYPIVGAALLWTLEKGLGEGFTPEVKDAWATAYGTLSGAMIAAAYPQPQA
jgi:nitric oxide dioxygenase